MTLRVEHRSGKDDWETPSSIFDPLNREFTFDLDVCATRDNTKCGKWLSPEQDGLKVAWHISANRGTCWCNPPYSKWQAWVEKAATEAKKGATVVMLLPARTDTRAFHSHIWQQPLVELRFIKGRVKFVGAEHGAPFPSMIVVFHPHPQGPTPSIEDPFFSAPPLLTYLPKSATLPEVAYD